MNRWRCRFLLILVVGCATAETVKKPEELIIINGPIAEQRQAKGEMENDAGKLDYESALRPAILQKRSIANIARLLLGGNVPPNHPLVKYPEPKTWNLASNIVASLPNAAAALNAAASTNGQSWARQPGQTSTLENIQQLFETKAKIIPYTGQVATGLTGLASVKGDLLRQIHSISTQAIAQAAAEAAARALAGAAAAHAVTNSIHSVVSPGGQTGIKGGWSAYQPNYADKPGPGDQPGPPYHSSSAHINHYQASPQYNPYATTPSPLSTLPSPYQQAQNQPYQNGYYTLYNTNTQQAAQTPYTPSPPVGHARPTLSPNTLIATTPSAPAGIFTGRNAPQSSSTSSLLSTISSLLSASTAAYNAAFTGGPPAQQQTGAFLSNLLSSSSSIPSNPAVQSSAGSSIFGSAANAGSFNNGYGQQSANSLSQGGSNYGSPAGSGFPSYLHNSSPGSSGSYGAQANPSSFHSSSYPFNQHASSNAGASYAQPGTNPYSSSSIQSSSQFGAGDSSSAGFPSGSSITISGSGSPSYSSAYPGGYPSTGPGYSGYNAGSRSSPGHISRWNSQSSGSSLGSSTFPGTNFNSPGYSGAASGNFNNPSGSYGAGGPAAHFSASTGSGSSLSQQAYSPLSQNAYQSSTSNAYAPAPIQQFASFQSPLSISYGASGLRNPNLNSRYDSHDLSQSASNMGNDYEDDEENQSLRNSHHSHQQAQRKQRPSATQNSHSTSRFPNPGKKRPSNKKPSQLYNSHIAKSNLRQQTNGGKRVIPTGDKKGFHFDSLVDVDDVDVVDNYFEDESSILSHESPTKNRWRTKNSSGQRPHSFHNHNSHDGWRGKASNSKQTSSTNVRGHGSKGVRSQPGQQARTSSSHRNKKNPSHHSKSKSSKGKTKSYQTGKAQAGKAQAENLYRGREQQQQSGAEYKPRDVYTTLPEYVFRIGERPDVFVRPGGKWKHRGRGGFLRPRVGQTDGSGSTKSKSSKTKEKVTPKTSKATYATRRISQSKKYTTPSYHDEEETETSYNESGSEEAEEQAAPPPKSKSYGKIIKSTSSRGEDEEFISSSDALDADARTDVLSASEEFDPEEREAFVEDVYSSEDQINHHPPHRRQDIYGSEDGEIEEDETNQEGEEDEEIEKK